MSLLRACVRSIDTFTDRCGRLLAWLGLGMALLTALIVIMRYGFNIGSILAQEAVIYMHGSLFLLGAAYAQNMSKLREDLWLKYYSRLTGEDTKHVKIKGR